MRAVVADRARFQRRILLLLLEGLGIEGEEAETFEALRNAEVDLAFADLSVLPESPGPLPKARRFVVTGPAAEDERLAAWIDAGADGFLLKPFTRDALARALEDLDLEESIA